MEYDQFSINEIDFLMKQQNLTTILPSYSEERVYNLIQGDFGPFKPNIPAQVVHIESENLQIYFEKVPLWLALHLKKSNKCRIVPPDWLNVEVLTDVFTNEKQDEELQNLPFHFFEIAHILIKSCGDILPNIQKLRSTLEDIEDLRQTKIENKMAKIDQNTKFIRFNNISQFEVSKRRKVLELFLGGLSTINKIVQKNNIDASKFTLSQSMSQNKN